MTEVEEVEHDLTTFGGIYRSVLAALDEIGIDGNIHRLSRLQADLSLDSLDAVELVMSFEDAVNGARGEDEEKFSIPDDDARGLYFPLQVAIYIADRLEVPVPDKRRTEMEARRTEIQAYIDDKSAPEPKAYGGKNDDSAEEDPVEEVDAVA